MLALLSLICGKLGPDECAQLECGTNTAATNVIAVNIRLFGPLTNIHRTWTWQWCGSRFVQRNELFFVSFFDITKRFAVHIWMGIGHCFVCQLFTCGSCNFFMNCSVFSFHFFHTPVISMRFVTKAFFMGGIDGGVKLLPVRWWQMVHQ